MKPFLRLFLPPNSLRRKLLKKILVKLHLKSPVIAGYYNTWWQQQKEHPVLREMVEITDGPLISIVVPVYNTKREHFDALVYSIISQSYQNWELVLVNASTDQDSRTSVKDFAQKDKRIKIIDVENKGISENTNHGIQKASGDYIVFCDHDDLIEPFALEEIVLRIINEQAELVYSDEDKVSDNGEVYFDPHFKPDWSPDLLTHVNYINHLTAIKRVLIEKAGLLDPAKDGAQDYDLLLRVTDLQPRIAHVPHILYHWRAAQTSTAYDFSSKKRVTDAGKAALEEHFKRQKVAVTATPKDNRPGFYELHYPAPKAVSLIVTPFASHALIKLYIKLLLKGTATDKVAIELFVPRGAEPDIEIADERIIVHALKGEQYIEKATAAARHEIVVVIQQVIVPQDSNWLSRLSGPLSLQHVGAVAPLIVREGSVIEDCGLVQVASGESVHLFRDQAAFGNQTFFGNTDWVRNVDALSGNVIALRNVDLKHHLKEAADKSLKALTIANKNNGLYNVIFAETVVDNYSIRLAPAGAKTTYFNSNLIVSGRDYEPYTPEASAIAILQLLLEQRGEK